MTLRLGAYKDYLLRQFGEAQLDVWINEHLVARAAAEAGIEATPERLERWIESKLEQTRGMREFAELGWEQAQWEELRRQYRRHARMGFLLEELAKRRRTEGEGLRREYEARYGERRRARHILYAVRVPPGAEAARRAELWEAARRKAERAVERLRAGEDFAALARRESEDPATAHRGGELPAFARPDMVEEFAAVAFSLEPGAISEPVRSQYGWHVIQVLEIIPPARPCTEEVLAEIRAAAAARPVDQGEVNRLLEELRARAQIRKLWPPAGAD
ncbi:MAG: hypothetical protein KatS3mg102_2580 [Planctomycetota bacterium]|nr:MAG: hypothetical protein KatS3mg102_2580 [Planctomycetota bacterium]